MADIFGNPRVPNPKPGSTQANYMVGRRHYGGGRSNPNSGAVSGTGLMGYANRELKAKARKEAMMRRLKAQMSGNVMNSNILGVM